MKPSNNATMLFVVAAYWWWHGRDDLANDAIGVALLWVNRGNDLADAQ